MSHIRRSRRSRVAATIALASLSLFVACSDQSAPARSIAPRGKSAGEAASDDPGTRPPDMSLAASGDRSAIRPRDHASSTVLLATTGLRRLYSEVGKLTLSVDGVGTNNASGTVRYQKAAGATVRKAYLFAATTGFNNQKVSAQTIKLNGTTITWDAEVANGIHSYNGYADVTALVQPVIDAAPAGIGFLTVSEGNPVAVDGEILAVVFDDASLTHDQTVTLMFGAQQTTGDDFSISLADPLDTTDPALQLDMGLGISFGFQGPGNMRQSSTVTVNGTVMTTCAGGQDETQGATSNGTLLTVGGIGDTNGPPDCASASGARADDELYDLRPFTHTGDTQISVHTINPSNDDNIFFASLTLSVSAQVVVVTPGDQTPPVITESVSGPSGSNGWFVGDVNVSFAVADGESAISSEQGCSATTVTTNTAGQTFTCTATSAGGTATKSVVVKRDATIPAVSYTLGGTVGTDNWFVSDATVTWSVSPAGPSGMSAVCAAATLSTDTSGQAYSCTVTTGAGRSGSNSVTIKRDATIPVIAYTGNAGAYTVDQSINIHCSATDAMSGVASSTCADVTGAAYTYALGPNTVSATARDNAGNTASASTTFTVNVTPQSLCALTQRFVSQSGIANSLCQKLDAAAAAFGRGNADAAHNILAAYVNEVSAQSGKAVSDANAAILTTLARAM